MRSPLQLLVWIAVLAGLFIGPAVFADETGSHKARVRQQLSLRLARYATSLLAAHEQPTLEAVELATLLAHEAVAIDSANEHAWRIVLQLAEIAEDEVLQGQALEAIAKLDPADEVVRLKLAQRFIDQHQTLEDRVQAYERLLTGPQRKQLGEAVASRLALDLALLERRAGNTAQFAYWLAEAAACDPSYRDAAALAAGYFHANVSDPFAQGELLAALLMADPIQTATQTELAAHLLEHAAYKGAERLYKLAMSSSEAAGAWMNDEVIADLAIAQWGNGDTEAALRTVRDFQRRADGMFRQQLQELRPEMTVLERAQETAVISPTLAVIRAAIHQRLGNDLAESSVQRAAQSYESVIRTAVESEQLDRLGIAKLQLELAWVLVWLDGSDPDRVTHLLEAAEQYEPLGPTVRGRFDGWLALQRGDYELAIQTLEEFVEEDSACALGYATALLKTGEIRDGARQLLQLAREQAGTVIGVWSLDLLWEVLGQRSSVATETGQKLERLVAAIPNVIDQMPENPTSAISLRVIPAKATFQPNEPVIVNLEITNHAPFPIAISKDGPIRTQVLLMLSAEMVRSAQADRLPPVVVDIDRRLRLMPRERLVVPIDLRTTALGIVLDGSPLPGAIVRVKGVLNFYVTQYRSIMPGVLGMERETAPFRIDGYRVTGGWLEETMALLIKEPSDIDLARLVCLAHLVAGSLENQPEGVRQTFREARRLLIDLFPQLDSDTQAWLMSVLPNVDVFEPIRAAARQSQDRAVQLSYLLHQVSRYDDPMLAAAARSGDRMLSRLAELVQRTSPATGSGDELRAVPMK